MFQFLTDASPQKTSESKLPFLTLGKAKEVPEERVNSRIDLLSATLEAQLPDRGYIKH